MENGQNESGPAAPSDDESTHKVENLKMTQKKTRSNDRSDSPPSGNEWTVVYSDSNSSVLDEEDDEEDMSIDISVVDEAIIEKNEEDEIDDLNQDEGQKGDNKENESPVVFPITTPHIVQFGTMKKLDEIAIADSGSKIQIWEQSADPGALSSSSSNTAWKPILVTAVDVNDEDTPPSPPPSFADNEYESSDIDIINDDDDDLDPMGLNDDRESIMSLSISSIISQSSNLSQLREEYLKAHLSKQAHRSGFNFKYFANKDDSASDDDDSSLSNANSDALPLMNKGGRIRAYVHTPNTGLNFKLNAILIVSFAVVLGLGIGHFLGWSKQWGQQNQLSMGQVIKLKQLQDDLLVCMKNQDLVSALDSDSYGQEHFKFSQVCFRDSDYWKQRFETLFSENKGLMEVFQKTQKHFHENGLNHDHVIEEHECVNKTTSDEFHKLKLDMLVNQMEHLKLLEVLHAVKTKQQQSEKRVRVLEGENLDLKKKLVEEEEDDHELEETWGNRVAVLQNENEVLRKTIVEDDVEDMKVMGSLRQKVDALNKENQELRQIIDQLDKQTMEVITESRKWKSRRHRGDEQVLENSSYYARYNILRDRINQMMSENEELKAKIARYRWTSESRKQRHEHNERKNDDDEETREKSQRNGNEDGQMDVLKAKIGVLNHQLQMEQNESRKWKERFESAIKRMKHMQEKHGKSKDNNLHQSTSDVSEEEENEQEEYETYQEKFSKNKWNSFHKKWNKRFETISDGSRKFFAGFYEKVRNKWDRLHKKYSAEFTAGEPLNGDRLIQIGQFLESAIENVHNFSENLLHKGMRSEVMTYLSDRITDFASMLEKNLNLNQKDAANNKPKQAKDPKEPPFEHSPEEQSDQEEDVLEDEVDFEVEPDSYPDIIDVPPPYPSIHKKRNWLSERAKAREKYRRLNVKTNFAN